MSINRIRPGLQSSQSPNTPIISTVPSSSSQSFAPQIPIQPPTSQIPSSYLYEPQPLIQQVPTFSFQNQSSPVNQPPNTPPVSQTMRNFQSNTSYPYVSEVPQQQSYSYANSIPQQSPFNFGYNNQFLSSNIQPIPISLPYAPLQSPHPMAHYMNIGPSIKLLKEKQKAKKVVAIIVTFHSDNSYDNLFSNVQQKTLEGTQVIVYSCNAQAIFPLIKSYKGQIIEQKYKGDETPKLAKEIVNYTKQIDPDCVVFNWECSSGYTCEHFAQKVQLIEFLGLLLSKGFMTMFSDFSLKALINDWDQSVLGKNPFKRTGAISGSATLKFKPSVLKECPSSQLQLLGDLTEGGKCSINCAGNTILYTVDKDSTDKQVYTLQVLTIRLTSDQLAPNYRHEIEGEFGDAGHVLLRYKSGGMILTSMGHWIELMKIDPSQNKFFEVAQRQYGASYATAMQAEYNQLSGSMKAQYLSSNAVQFVQNQAPCSNMNRKSYN